MPFDFRIGQGYDVHRLVPERPLVLGGVAVPYERGLLGHSDADVLLHAVTDAVLGAAGLGDIGRHFPDTDAYYKGIASIKLLEEAARLIAEAGWTPVNVDATVVAQAPKLAPYRDEMAANIARVLNIETSAVNVKATTEEGLGFTGRGDGIAAYAVCLLYRGSISSARNSSA
jgi:2-C-methyl-D-erythritol 2,4-cyclodiphosphate synthase